MSIPNIKILHRFIRVGIGIGVGVEMFKGSGFDTYTGGDPDGQIPGGPFDGFIFIVKTAVRHRALFLHSSPIALSSLA